MKSKNTSSFRNKLWRSSQLSVAVKSIIAVGMVMTLMATMQILYSTYSARHQVETESLERLKGYYQVYETHVEAESNASQALALSIANREDIQKLYLRGDREGLYKLLLPLFEEMKKHQIVHLYIHNPDGTVFLRVHDPKKFGDSVTYRETMADAIAGQTETAGIEIGPNRLGIRGVAPMKSDGKLIGLVEVGIDYDKQFVSDLKDLDGADYTMWVSYAAAKAAGLKPVEGEPASPFKDVFYYTSSGKNLLPISAGTYQSVFGDQEAVFQVLTKGLATPSATYITPLLGYKGKVIGLLEISFPYVDTLQDLNSAILITVAITAGLTLLGLLIIAFFNTQVILRPLTSLSEFATKQLEGNLSARVLVQTGDEFEHLATSFNNLAESVEAERTTLEQRVADRTRALTTSAAVTSRLAVVTTSSQLAAEVVNQIQSAFDFYHAHIYFVDEANGDLVMAGGTGEAGSAMLARGHKIAKGRGLVGRAADTNAPVLVSDVSKEEGWLPNPLLPDTKSEVAIPITLNQKVLGVLDVQQSMVNGFVQDDVELLQSIAGQVAISLQTARSFEQTKAKAALESMVNTIGQKIQRATTVEDTLQIAVREVGIALGASRVSANLSRSEDNENLVTSK